MKKRCIRESRIQIKKNFYFSNSIERKGSVSRRERHLVRPTRGKLSSWLARAESVATRREISNDLSTAHASIPSRHRGWPIPMTGYRTPGVAESRGGGTTSAFLLPDASAPESTHEFYLRHVRLSRTREGGRGIIRSNLSFFVPPISTPSTLSDEFVKRGGEKLYFSIRSVYLYYCIAFEMRF